MKKKHIIPGLAVLFIVSSPIYGQDYTNFRPSCEQTIQISQRRIQGFVSVDKSRMDARYNEFPQEKPYRLRISFQSRQSPSKTIMIQVSQQILSACNDISVVSFGLTRTDYIRDFGVINGTIREFQCLTRRETPTGIDWETPSGEKIKEIIPWGYIVCL